MPTQKITRTNLPGALKAHAIIIAINRYDKIGAHLRTPIADGKALAEVLINYQGFAKENVHTCYDPSKRKLRAFLRVLKRRDTIDPKDALLFYYAGHGLAGDVDGAGAAGYLMPRDVSFAKVELSKNRTLIKMEWLFEQLESFDCHHTLAIMDCCFAGAFRRISQTRATMGLGLRPTSKERFRRYQEKRAWQVLASAGPAEKAADLISERGETNHNSPFAQALVKVLGGKASADFKPAGKNLGDGVLTAHELFIFLHDEVERRTRKSTTFKPQNPDLFPMGQHDGGQFIFCDPRHPHNDPKWDERKRKNPYKGLAQYDLADADYYFGRTSDVENLRQLISLSQQKETAGDTPQSPTLLLVSGPSGSGKSSLVKAGLLPAYLEKDYEVFQFRPGDRPWSMKQYQKGEWKEVLGSETHPFRFVPPSDLEQTASTEDLPEFLSPQNFYLEPSQKQVLYIDQFEELFTTCNQEEQRALNTTLKALFTKTLAKGSELRIIISMRSDFEWQLELSEFGQQFWGREYDFYKLYRLISLGLDDLRSALVNPATLFAYEFQQDEEGDLADTILEDLNYLPSALPLLSYTMQEMVKETNQSERRFLLDTYRKTIGGVSGALSKRMEAVHKYFGGTATKQELSFLKKREDDHSYWEDYQELVAKVTNEAGEITAQQKLVRQIFLRMVSLSDGEYTRRRVYHYPQLNELEFSHNRQDVEDILDVLRAASLISTGGEAGIRYEELIHDSLINTWTTGKQWINEFGKENLMLQRQLWQAVGESMRMSNATQNPALANSYEAEGQPASTFSNLWDTNPKLMQVIQQIADQSTFLLELPAQEFAVMVLGEGPDADRAKFLDFWQECLKKETFPDLNSFILSGFSEELLATLLQEGNHWLNLAEVAFVQQSWEKRIEGIIRLQRERDEAKASAGAAKARQYYPQDNTIALNLALAARRLAITEESSSAFCDIVSNPDTKFYKKFTGHDRLVGSVAFSPDGQKILTGSDDGKVKLWHLSGELLQTFAGDARRVLSVAFSPDGQTILTGGMDKKTKLWRLSGERLQTFSGHKFYVYDVAFSPDGQTILTGSGDGTAKLWQISGEEIQTFTGHTREVYSVAFSPDGQTILTGSRDETAKLWRISGKLLQDFTGHENSVHSVVFSPDGQMILTGGGDKSAKLWQLSGQVIQTFEGHTREVYSVAFSPDGQTILTGSNDNTAKTWRLSGETLQTINNNEGAIKSVTFSPDGQTILTGSRDKTAKLWYLSSKPLQTFTGDEKGISCLTFSPDGQTILTGGSGGVAKLWRLSGELLQTFTGHEQNISCLTFSPDGQKILTGSGDKTAKLWHLSGELLQTFSGQEEAIASVAFSPDGQTILMGSSDATTQLRDLSGQQLQTFNSPYSYRLSSVAFSPDGQTILTGHSRGGARLWRLSGELLQTFSGDKDGVNSVAFSPNGQKVLTGSNKGTAKLWHLSGELLRIFTGRQRSPYEVAFSPDGQTILTGGTYGTELWRLSGEVLQTFNAAGYSVAFSPDGQTILTRGKDKTVKLWRNLYGEYTSDTLWNRIHKLPPEEQAENGIDWKY